MIVELSEFQIDCLKEVFNIGMGRAAESLSTIFDEEVILSIPKVIAFQPQSADQFLSLYNSNPLCSVSQTFQGKDINAGINLVFTGEKSLELVRTFLGTNTPINEMSDLEDDALLEIGNIILNSFIGSVANIIQVEFDITLPTLHKYNLLNIFLGESSLANTTIIAGYVEFKIISKSITGLLLLTIESGKLEDFINTLINSMV
jgi:chemotaxis protein CheC